ncbi:golgin subfamily A member 4-like isoform X3 [Belonocnema kinseyi]|uniref:golgin subfamily A member 4-like isoform X3 n=1 Tax=Belonocnema kinseyi TaxID=2817044 RepID=UPI00143DE20A|nr:golgin subfamily A member 4-like isoform X3 [Belonocnema kinseyi]
MDEDERRRRALEAGKEMLEKFKAERMGRLSQASDADSLRINMPRQYLEAQGANAEGVSSRDITYSSVSMSEGEGEGELEGMAGRVAELEELLHGKEAMVEALNAELDHLRGENSSPNSSHNSSHTSSIQNNSNIIAIYHSKLQEFESAVQQRDKLIEDLTSSLVQALGARDSLVEQLNALNALQLGSPNSEKLTRDKISALESNVTEQKNVISDLKARIKESQERLKKLEMEKELQNSEIGDYKMQINNLNKEIRASAETLEQQKLAEVRVEKVKKEMQVLMEKFSTEISEHSVEHQKELKDLETKYESDLESMKKNYEDNMRKLKEDQKQQEIAHTKELAVFQAQVANYKKTVEALRLELMSRSDIQNSRSDISFQRSKLEELGDEMLNEEIRLHKIQLDDMTAKYIAAASVLESKESIERSLEQALSDVAALKQENEVLKFKMDDLSARYAAAQSLIENNQMHERSLSSKIYDLEKSMSRISGISSNSSPFDATVYQTLDEFAVQYQHNLHELEEKSELEKKLQRRIDELEGSVRKANEELELANLAKKSYEKQLKDMKNIYDKASSADTCSVSSSDPKEMLEALKKTLREKEAENLEYKCKLEAMNSKTRKVEEEREKLKNGLAAAWAECAEYKRLNLTLMGESRVDDSISERSNLVNESNLNLGDTNLSLQIPDKNTTDDSSKTIANSPGKTDISKLQEADALAKENEELLKELKEAMEKQKDYEEMEKKIGKYYEEFERVKSENEKLLKEIGELKDEADSIDSLKQCVNRLNKENEAFVRRIDEMCEKHKLEINEAEKRHQEAMEELRTYFEQKCLQMEKQYSEEVFSQQSKKMSDDSEIEDLTEDLYFGGAGDCPNVDNSSKIEAKNEETSMVIREYKEKVETLQQELKNFKEKGSRTSLLKAINQCCQTDLDETALESSELTKLRAAYSHQLEEQVALARLDIVNALQDQIQTLLTIDADVEENWPSELLELRNKFTNNAKREIQELRDKHELEVKRLKEDHNININVANRTIKRYEEEIKKLKEECNRAIQSEQSGGEKMSLKKDLLQERDNLHKTCRTLKNLVGDLINFFAVCEDEVNNTFISEVQKRQTPQKSVRKISESIEGNKKQSNESTLSSSEDETVNKSLQQVKRVHFAPNSNEISSIINSDNESLAEIIENDIDIAKNFRKELNKCLNRLKTESAEILGVPFSLDESNLDQLSKQVMWLTKVNEELSLKLSESENTMLSYQEEAEQLKAKIQKMQKSLMVAENKKEIISEGYGEQDQTCEDELQDISQLQDRARSVIMNGSGDNTYLLQLVEELCRHNDKISDDSKREKDDLQNQIAAADKQLRAMKKFLEEQTSEREAEIDEATKKIENLEILLRDVERTKERDQRMTSEQSSLSPVPSSEPIVLRTTDAHAAVEALESQMREMTSLMSDTEAKKSETESELKAAVDKIWVLRDIITDLEQQLQTKVEREELLQTQIDQLEELISAQNRNQQELAQELESIKSGSENVQLNDHISHLQEELRKHKLSSEHFNSNSSTLKQIRMELREMHNHVDKRIKELEALHVCGSSLSISQPSEDVSIRDQIEASRCPTPDDPNAPPTLPLDQVLKLKDKLMKHARAEEVALKRIKDLSIQLTSLKNQNEELQAEQEILQQTASEQLFQMEAMRGRLEQQKQDAPFAQRQATSRLELQLHETNTKLHSMERLIADKDLELKEIREQLERANQILMEKEIEIANVVQSENDVIQKLKDRLEIAEEEKKVLESKFGKQERAQIELPQLLDSMLADKNEEIDHLKEQLQKKEKQLELYLSLNLDENQLKEMAKQEPKNSARTLSDILSINSECEEYQEGIREVPNSTRNLHNVSSFRVPQPGISKDTLELSPNLIERNKSIQVPQLELGLQSQSMSNSYPRESREFDTGLEKSEADSKSPNGELLESQKSQNISPKSRKSSDELMKEQIHVLETQLKRNQEELNLKSESLRQKEAELIAIQVSQEELRLELKDTAETLIRDKLFFKSQYELSQVSENKIRKDLDQVENAMKLKIEELEDYKSKVQVNEKILIELRNENSRLKKTDEALKEKCQEVKYLSEVIFQKDVTIETLQTRNVEIENENKQLYDYRRKYDLTKEEIIGCQSEIQRLTLGLNNRDDIIKRLEDMARRSSFSDSSPSDSNKNQEIHHLQEYLKEKDKVIRQMSDDSKSLHRALETIQNKMKESGNVVELRKKLKEERKINLGLKESLEKVVSELERLKEDGMQEDEGIEDMVQRELNLSAQLDRQIMDAIESEPEEGVRRMEKHSCNSLNIKPDGYKQEKLIEKLSELKSKLRQTSKEKEELNRLKDDLEIEKEMLRSQVAEYESRILQIKSELEEERKKVTGLDEEIFKQRNGIRSLNARIEKERKNMESLQEQDAELLSALRKKLTSSVKAESKLREELNQVRQDCQALEIQLSTLTRQEKSFDGNAKVPSEMLEQEHQKYFKLTEKFEKEQRNNEELRDNLKLKEIEKRRCEEQLEIAIEKQESLNSKLALVECDKDQLSTNLCRIKGELRAKEEECEFLQKKIKTMTDAEAKRQEKKSNDNVELKRLRREMENNKDVLRDLEVDLEHSRTELKVSLERQAQLARYVESLTEEESELNRQLASAKDEERRLKEVISNLQAEIQGSLKREVELSDELRKERISTEKNVPLKYLEKIKELNDTLEKYSHDKAVLSAKLSQVREEKELFALRARSLETQFVHKRPAHSTGALTANSEEKLQHFYGKYLRTDSRRKALVYQKKYLIGVLTCYQRSEENTLAFLAQLTQTQRTCTRKNSSRKNAKAHFRSVALVIISVHRMKWMIMRWRTGKRVGAHAILDDPEQSYVPLRPINTNHSPPVRDSPLTNGDQHDRFDNYLHRFLSTYNMTLKKNIDVDHSD